MRSMGESRSQDSKRQIELTRSTLQHSDSSSWRNCPFEDFSTHNEQMNTGVTDLSTSLGGWLNY